ncbi:MAG: M16 family metallopeptidase [Janthinobacterium lividum]
MKIMAWIVSLFCLCASAEAALFNPKVHTLSNGLTLIVIENHRAPLVTHMMCLKVGTNKSPWGKSGMAHYLEHLMFKGKPGSVPERFMNDVSRLGGDSNAMTSSQYTFYHETIPVSALETVMKLDAERLTQLDIQDEWAVPEVKVILEERYMSVDNTVMGSFRETFDALAIRHHPSRLPIIGWAHEIAAYTTQDALDFYNKWYAPNNTFVVIAGDITFEKAKELAEKCYGIIPAKTLPSRLDVKEPKSDGATQDFTMTSEISDAPFVVTRYSAPTLSDGDAQKFYALAVLEDLLGRSVTGRLTKALMETKHLASQIQIDYDGLKSGPGFFEILMMPTPETSLTDLEKAVSAEIDQLMKNGVTQEEVQNAKDHMLSDLVYTQDNVTKAAHNLAYLHACGLSIDQIEAWPDSVKSVTPAQVNAVVKQIFSNPQHITGRLIPKQANTSETSHDSKK